MPRLNIGQLPPPPDSHRVDRVTYREDGVIGFERKRACRCEDRERARLLLSSADRFADKIDARAAKHLAQKLQASADGGEAPKTLASSLYMGGQRIRVVGWLWMALEGKLP